VPREQRATILDVAARAGVHAATVSRTINVPEKVAPETRRRVEEAVRELGFVPNRAARGLITGRTGNVAVIVPDITNPHFASLVRSVERSARQGDLQVLLVDTGEHPDEEVRAVESLSREVDGFIVVSPRRLHRALGALGSTPAVFVNRPVREHGSILLRTGPAVGDALQHLAGLGHARLAYLGGPSSSWAAGERRTAVRQSSPASGVQVVELAVGEPTFEAAGAVVPDVVASGATAVLAFNDQMALGVIAGLTNLGISVPHDVSVVGIDDVPMAAMVAPPLTTISLPTNEVGAVAVAMLDEGPAKKELFGELVVRHSAARAR
jgi:LacI family transcriptional regulator